VSFIVGIEHPVLNKLGLQKHGGSPKTREETDVMNIYQTAPSESTFLNISSIMQKYACFIWYCVDINRHKFPVAETKLQ
jgi:hypothetical protein